MEKKDKLENIDLKHLTFASSEEIFYNQYVHKGECVDLFEELSEYGEQELE